MDQRHLVLLTLAAVTGACGNAVGVGTPAPAPSARATPTSTTTSTATAPLPTTTAPVPTATTPSPAPTVTPHDQLPALLAEPVRTAPAAPIAGGTLLVTADGATAVAADPDRDQVFLVDLASHSVRSAAANAGDQLGRVVEGPPGVVFVAARRGGAVLAIDLASASVKARFPVCNAPRGLAYDGAQSRLYVACRSGRLVALDATTGAVSATVDLDDDLRDVVLVNGSLVLTRFRSAEILRIDAAGRVTTRTTPPNIGLASAAVAYRTIGLPNGMILMTHQVASDAPLGTGVGSYYGGGCSGGAVDPVVSLVSLDGTALATPNTIGGNIASSPEAPLPIRSTLLGGALGPLDVAVSHDGKRIAIVASGNSWTIAREQPTLYVDNLDLTAGALPAGFATDGCAGATSSVPRHAPGEPVAVAFDPFGHYVVQSREPAMLELEGDVFVPLSSESHFDTGFAMFHMNASGGISCASCHPEGGDDGHVWTFVGAGLRRSQALEANVGSRAPFHWSGDLPTFDDLFGEVMLKRMSLPVTPPHEDVAALLGWLDTIPALSPADGLDPAAVARGQALFFDDKVGCGACHSGPSYSDSGKHDVGTGGTFVTPALLGVGLRSPLMHDGCARTLKERFGACGGDTHGITSELSDADVDALVAFMRSL